MLRSATEADEGFDVWPVNMPVVEAFLTVATQWRTVPLADGRVHWQGLDYTAVRAALKDVGVMLSPVQRLRLNVIERAAADVLNGVRG